MHNTVDPVQRHVKKQSCNKNNNSYDTTNRKSFICKCYVNDNHADMYSYLLCIKLYTFI